MLVIDVETTGLDPIKNGLASIGAVDMNDPIPRTFYGTCYVPDNKIITPEALEVNGFTLEQLKDKNKFSPTELVAEFLDWALSSEEITIAGHNPTFDTSFIRENMPEGVKWPFGYRTVDLHSVAYGHMRLRGIHPPLKDKRTNISLDTVLNYVGLKDEPKPHLAVVGAMLSAEAFHRIFYFGDFFWSTISLKQIYNGDYRNA